MTGRERPHPIGWAARMRAWAVRRLSLARIWRWRVAVESLPVKGLELGGFDTPLRGADVEAFEAGRCCGASVMVDVPDEPAGPVNEFEVIPIRAGDVVVWFTLNVPFERCQGFQGEMVR